MYRVAGSFGIKYKLRAQQHDQLTIFSLDLTVTEGREGGEKSQGHGRGPCAVGAGEDNIDQCEPSSYILPQARGVLAMDGGTSSDPYCKVFLDFFIILFNF